MGDPQQKDPTVYFYWLNYRIKEGTVKVWVNTDANQSDSAWKLVKEVTPDQAVFFRDLLAAETTLYLDKSISLHTGPVKRNPPA